MSINPLSSTLGGYAVQRPATDAARQRTEQSPARANEGVGQQPAPTLRAGIAEPAQRSLSPVAPAGTDPELWSVLTSEERTFFAKVGSMGPLTYGRMTGSATPGAPPSIRGGRLDVKV